MSSCPVCSENKDLKKIESFQEYTLYQCPACDVVFSQPMRNPGSQWYEEGYVDDNSLNEFLPLPIIWWHRKFLASRTTYGKDLLDIGCGTGRFLHEARNLGYRVSGIDFNSESIRIAKKRFGLDCVERLSVESYATKHPDRKFDVITFFEVLEHMDDPNKFITQVKSRLRPGGFIALSVPNRLRFLDALGEGDYPPHHLTRWNTKALGNFIERHGFEIKEISVKEFTVDDLSLVMTHKLINRAKKKITKDVASRASSNEKPPFIYRNYQKIKKLKDYAMKAALFPLIPIIKVVRPQGWTVYCLARLR